MARIAHVLGAISAEVEDEWNVERDGDPLQGLQVDRADAAFRSSDDLSPKAGPICQVCLHPGATMADRADLTSQPSLALAAAAGGLGFDGGSAGTALGTPLVRTSLVLTLMALTLMALTLMARTLLVWPRRSGDIGIHGHGMVTRAASLRLTSPAAPCTGRGPVMKRRIDLHPR